MENNEELKAEEVKVEETSAETEAVAETEAEAKPAKGRRGRARKQKIETAILMAVYGIIGQNNCEHIYQFLKLLRYRNRK